LSTVEDLLVAFRDRLRVPWRPDEAAAGRVWMLWYDKTHERRVRGRLGEFRELAEREGRGWHEFDLAPQFGQWVAQQKWFERAARRPSTLSMVLPQFEDELVRKVRDALKDCSRDDLLVLTGVASLFGITRTSTLIARVSDAIQGRMLVTFPGTHQSGAGTGEQRCARHRSVTRIIPRSRH
jgi:hypothetical protein